MTTCDQRVVYLQVEYGASLTTAKITAMKHISCLRKGNQTALENLDAYCGACAWRAEKTCDQRVLFLHTTYNTSMTDAKTIIMMDNSCIDVE